MPPGKLWDFNVVKSVRSNLRVHQVLLHTIHLHTLNHAHNSIPPHVNHTLSLSLSVHH